MKSRVSMITLGVRDLSAAIDFYDKRLSFLRLESPPEVPFFILNGTWLGLYGRGCNGNVAFYEYVGHKIFAEADFDSQCTWDMIY